MQVVVRDLIDPAVISILLRAVKPRPILFNLCIIHYFRTLQG